MATLPARANPRLLLRSVALDRDACPGIEGFPFSVPAVRHLGTLAFRSPVTFFVGENGSGKSTLLEAMAWALESVGAGSERIETDPTLEAVRPLGRALRPVWSRRTRRGLFLRAEDFFGYVKRVNREREHYEREARRVRAENPHLHEGELRRIASPYTGSAAGLRARYGEDMDGRSHGEQFLAFFGSRVVPQGLYLLDEPEAPLSPSRQLALLSMLKTAVEEGSQFLIATHSPILMALPGACLLHFGDGAVQEVAYDDLEHVRLTREFLSRPEAFLRHL